jgi:hypothetical protein
MGRGVGVETVILGVQTTSRKRDVARRKGRRMVRGWRDTGDQGVVLVL